ncbi:HIT family protein [Nonomuraea sp. MTCD27]|uniref:HIT family protein n=1 Tax=Nonomuraea sp. MTCD27 TaxID=1676747 RepID=UPI0035C221A8
MADGRYVAHHAQWSGSNSPGHPRSLRRAPLGDSKLPYPAAAFAGAWLHVEADTPNPEKLLGEMARTVRAEGVIGVHTADATDLHDSMLAEADRLGLRPRPGGAGQSFVATAPDLADGAHGDEHCVFCHPLRFRMNSVAGLPGAAGVLWGDDNVFVMPDLAPVAPGHLLIVTTEHLTALASADPGLIDVVESAKNRVRELFRAAYDGSDTVFVEHGPAQPSGGGNCVDHAHLHCLPAALVGSIGDELDAFLAEGRLPVSRTRVTSPHDVRAPYIYLEEAGTAQVAHLGPVVTSQLLRQIALRTTGDTGPFRWQERFVRHDSVRLHHDTLGSLLPFLGP